MSPSVPTFTHGTPLREPEPAPTSILSSSDPMETAVVAPATLKEVFPGVRIDIGAKLVEFDAAASPMLMADVQTPLLFLESIVCIPDTREHETLLVTRVRPSNVHAALLLLGLQPGKPGGWELKDDVLIPRDPMGPRLTMEFEWSAPPPSAPDLRIRVDPLKWIVSARDKSNIVHAMSHRAQQLARPQPGWVFAGSRMAQTKFGPDGTPLDHEREVYDADESGLVIGLATFGGEMIAWSLTFSPDAAMDEPEWIVDFSPPAPTPPPPAPNTPVVVRLRVE